MRSQINRTEQASHTRAASQEPSLVMHRMAMRGCYALRCWCCTSVWREWGGRTNCMRRVLSCVRHSWHLGWVNEFVCVCYVWVCCLWVHSICDAFACGKRLFNASDVWTQWTKSGRGIGQDMDDRLDIHMEWIKALHPPAPSHHTYAPNCVSMCRSEIHAMPIQITNRFDCVGYKHSRKQRTRRRRAASAQSYYGFGRIFTAGW